MVPTAGREPQIAVRFESIGGRASESQIRKEIISPPLPCADGVSNLVYTRWAPEYWGLKASPSRGACTSPPVTAPDLYPRLKLSPGITNSVGTLLVYPRPAQASSPIEP